jgi:hypothetical protein
VGAIRLIMASNNKNMIETTEALTNQDIEAINERILYVNASPHARDVLDGFGEAVSEIVTKDLLASHALYLKENAMRKPSGRFLIKAGDQSLARSLTTHSGIRSIVCQWLVSYLQRPDRYDAKGDYLIHVRAGELWVNAQALSESWDLYITNARAPTTHRLSQAIAGLAKEGRQQGRFAGKVVNYRVIDPENLLTWADENGISSREDILTALAKDTRIDAKRAISAVTTNKSTQRGVFG